MSGDFGDWNNAPNEAPKGQKTLYSEDRKHARHVVIWVDIGIGVLIAAGIIWYVFYR